MTFNVDADYEVVRTQLTQNVVGIVEGSDPQLKQHLRGVRRALRSRRLCGRRSAGRGPTRPPAPGPRHAGRRRRSHLERRRRRRVGHGGVDGAGAGVRAGTAAEAVAAVCLARRRRSRTLRLALLRRLSDRADRSHRRAAEHRHDRPKPRRQAERGEHRLSGRLRSHQQRAARDQSRGEPRAAASR